MQSKCSIDIADDDRFCARAHFHIINTFYRLSTEYRILGKKGEGTFSEVLKVQDIRDGTYFACKKMKQRYERYSVANRSSRVTFLSRPH